MNKKFHLIDNNYEFDCSKRKVMLGFLSTFGITACSGHKFISFTALIDPYKCTFGNIHTQSRINYRFERLDLKEQQGRELCWAAAVQSVYLFKGKRISQKNVVTKVRGTVNERGYGAASLSEILDAFGGNTYSWHVSNGVSESIVSDLMSGNVLLLGLRGDEYYDGHIIVVYGAEYAFGYDGRVYIEGLWIWDPSDGFYVLNGCSILENIEFSLHPIIAG
ncbi:hypothetical protein ACP3VU_16370 [Vibrio sp. PNB23_22_6]|uniref:hypothetical protein n=1 Tax=Vibrio TaxID=662 RepID=UPI0040693D06